MTICLTSCISPSIKPEKVVIVEKFDTPVYGRHNCIYKVKRLETSVMSLIVTSSLYEKGDTILYRFNTR